MPPSALVVTMAPAGNRTSSSQSTAEPAQPYLDAPFLSFPALLQACEGVLQLPQLLLAWACLPALLCLLHLLLEVSLLG